MNAQEAKKIVEEIKKFCSSDEGVWHDIHVELHPHLTKIIVEKSVKFTPKYTRKLELK